MNNLFATNKIWATLCFLVPFILCNAQNPIVPPGVYIADPSAHQWKDGKMYVYGSKDIDPKKYCSANYDVLSSSDLISWSIHPKSFSSAGEGDQVPYSDADLWAPDCIEKDGKYYLYYCLSKGANNEGVAISSSPIGPFINGEVIDGMRGIDPAVFIDDDGCEFNEENDEWNENCSEVSIYENFYMDFTGKFIESDNYAEVD